TILRNIRVYAVGTEINNDPATDERDAMPAKTMSLLVTPQQAQVLDLAQNLGRVSLVMRPPGETVDESDTAVPGGFTVADLLGGRVDAGDRAREGEVEDPLSPDQPSGLLGMLDGMKQKSNPPVAELDAAVWTMRLLTGPELQDITLEETTSPSGEKLWRIGSGDSKSASSDAADQSQTPVEPDAAASTPVEPQRDEPPLFNYEERE
ncbi:MAG: hypothetical protein GX621_16045, partial [Pirellulaceae bacterium]|nr:hypothetical protein [Pirellulaceae bacterium]